MIRQKHKLLREYRVRKGISPKEMAKKLGIAESTLRSLENGTRPITAELCRDIEMETEAELRRSDLWPEMFRESA